MFRLQKNNVQQIWQRFTEKSSSMKTGQKYATENQQRKVRTKNDAVVVTQLADGYFRYEGAQFESSHQQNLSSTHLF